jgi:hypothetical protein
MVNLNQLRAFYQAAKCRNLSIAAKNLFVSQPAVTAQVKLFLRKKAASSILRMRGKPFTTLPPRSSSMKKKWRMPSNR